MTEQPMPQIGLAMPTLNELTGNSATPNRKKSNTGSRGARVTPLNGYLLAFIGMFPGATEEAISLLRYAEVTQISRGVRLRSISTAYRELNKLHKLGLIERYTSYATETRHYGLTHEGFNAARSHGYNMTYGVPISGISIERLNHYSMIALAAAQFVSPVGWFREALGIEPVLLQNLITEKAQRGAYANAMREVKQASKERKITDFGTWRNSTTNEIVAQVKAGRIELNEILREYPAMWTLGHPRGENERLKATLQPDLSVYRDETRDTAQAKNLLIEVELTKKTAREYDATLRTLAEEFRHSLTYERAIYFTVGTQISTLIQKVNKEGEYGLIESGRLVILPLQHRSGDPVTPNRRIPVGGN